jgi:hypothetical protein
VILLRLANAAAGVSQASKRKQPEDITLKPELFFRSERKGTDHFTKVTLQDNNILPPRVRRPDFIDKILRTLKEKRTISTRQQV